MGDSMIKYLMSKKFLVIIQWKWEVTREQQDDFIIFDKLFSKKPNLIIIYTGTNDIQNNVNTLQKIRKVISSIRECDTGDNIQIALSSMIHQSDHDFEDKVKPFVPETPFLYTLKTDHRKVFYCFQGVEK